MDGRICIEEAKKQNKFEQKMRFHSGKVRSLVFDTRTLSTATPSVADTQPKNAQHYATLYQGDQIGRKFPIWATFKVSGDFLGENMVYCRYLNSSEGV